MKIINDEIKFKILNALSLNETEDVSKEKLMQLRSISLNYKDINLKIIKFNKEDFEHLKYIETLTLNGFEINSEIIAGLCKIKNLKFLILNHCNFKENLVLQNNLEKIIINYPHSLNMSIFKHSTNLCMIKIINAKSININDLLSFIHLSNIYLYNSNIKFFEDLESFEELLELHLDGSNKIDTVCKALESRGVKIYYSEEYLPS